MFSPRLPLFASLCLFLGGCASVIVDRAPDTGETSLYDSQPVKVETGIASWYRDHRTASGERFSGSAMAGAHKKLPFGSHVRVVDLKTGKSIIVRINDRGPYIRGRIIDLTVGAAEKLGIYSRGIAKVRIELLKEIPLMKKPNLHVPEKTRPKASPSPIPAKKSSVQAKSAPTATPALSPSPKPKVTRNRRSP